jgi:hypothetical protein
MKLVVVLEFDVDEADLDGAVAQGVRGALDPANARASYVAIKDAADDVLAVFLAPASTA